MTRGRSSWCIARSSPGAPRSPGPRATRRQWRWGPRCGGVGKLHLQGASCSAFELGCCPRANSAPVQRFAQLLIRVCAPKCPAPNELSAVRSVLEPAAMGSTCCPPLQGLIIGACICYDLNMPEIMRDTVFKGAELVVRIQGKWGLALAATAGVEEKRRREGPRHAGGSPACAVLVRKLRRPDPLRCTCCAVRRHTHPLYHQLTTGPACSQATCTPPRPSRSMWPRWALLSV